MADDFVEKVTFVADGIDEVNAQVKRLGEEALDAHKSLLAQNKALSDPAYVRVAERSRRLAEQIGRTRLAQRQDFEARERQRRVESGAYVRQQRADEQRLRVMRQIEHQERKALLQARYGRQAGGALAATERAVGSKAFGLGLGAAGAAGGFALSMARGGFQGTTQMAAFQNEWNLLQREFANALVPQMDWLTRQTRQVRGWLESQTPAQQQSFGRLATGAGVLGTLGAGASVVSKVTTGSWVPSLGAVGTAGGKIGGAAGAATGAAARFGGRAIPGLGVVLEGWDQAKGMYNEGFSLKSMGRMAIRGMDDIFGGGALARMLGYKEGGLYGQTYAAIFGSAEEEKKKLNAKPKTEAMLDKAGFDAIGSNYDTLAVGLARLGAEDQPAAADDEGSETNRLLGVIAALLQEQAGRNPPLRR